jgi:ribonuclease III
LSRPNSVSGFLTELGIPPRSGSLVEVALTHRSFAFEQPGPPSHNERLEFLGDAILGAVVTDLIYRRYPKLAEGDMAKLRSSVVETRALAEIARELHLGDHIRLGKGEDASGGRDKSSILADTFESIVGALFLERGTGAVARVLVGLFEARIDAIVASGGAYDAKTELQEAAVREGEGRPTYRLASSGPDHDKRYVARVYVGGELLGEGAGRSKKEAEQIAARQALDRLELRPRVRALELREGGSDARAS